MLDVLIVYIERWYLTLDVVKTEVVFRNGGPVKGNVGFFFYKG